MTSSTSRSSDHQNRRSQKNFKNLSRRSDARCGNDQNTLMSFKIMTVFRYMTRLFGRKRQVGCLFLCRNSGKLLLVERTEDDDDGQERSWGMIALDRKST